MNFPFKGTNSLLEQRSDSVLAEWKVCPLGSLLCQKRRSVGSLSFWSLDLNNHRANLFWNNFVMCYSIFNSSNHTSLKLLSTCFCLDNSAYSQFPIFILLYTQRQKNMCPCFINTQLDNTILISQILLCSSVRSKRCYQWRIKREGAVGKGLLTQTMRFNNCGREEIFILKLKCRFTMLC